MLDLHTLDYRRDNIGRHYRRERPTVARRSADSRPIIARRSVSPRERLGVAKRFLATGQ